MKYKITIIAESSVGRGDERLLSKEELAGVVTRISLLPPYFDITIGSKCHWWRAVKASIEEIP